MRGFSPGFPSFSHSQKNAYVVVGDSKLSIKLKVPATGCLPQWGLQRTGILFVVYTVFTQEQAGTEH